MSSLIYRYRKLVVVIAFFCTFSVLTVFASYIHQVISRKGLDIVMNIDNYTVYSKSPKTHYVPPTEYFESIATAFIPDNYETYESFSADAEVEIADASFTEQKITVSDANMELYSIADRYYTVYYGNSRVSPAYALALANCETGGRCDTSITWSALFPSRVVPIEYMYAMNVTTVLDDNYYETLTKEWSTRDRGALQMSPTYGTKNEYFNMLMSGTEKEKLQDISTTHTTWVNGASSYPGDRFYVPDVCLRLASADTDAINDMVTHGYEPESDYQLIAQLAMHHHQSGTWHFADHDKTVGKWKSGGLAYEWSKEISNKQFIKALQHYSNEHPKSYWITDAQAKELYADNFDTPLNHYATKELVCTYPIRALYAYIKMCSLYSEI